MKVHGRFGSLEVSDDGGANYTRVGGLEEIDPDGNLDEVECTNKDSGKVREYLHGRRDLTVAANGFWDNTDPGQQLVKDAFYDLTNLLLRFRMEDLEGADEWLDVDSIVTNYAPGSPNDDATTLAMSFRVTGEHTPTPQPAP